MIESLIGAVAAPLIGGLLGGSSGGNTSTQSQKMDPRLDKYVYGGDGNSGLLSDAQGIYKKQLSQGGLNPLQTAGLEMQRQQLMSPQYGQGYDAMRSLGMGLLGGGVAGNPFTGGATARSNTNMQYTPFRYNTDAFPAAYQQVAPQAVQSSQADTSDIQKIIDDYLEKNGYGKKDIMPNPVGDLFKAAGITF